MSFTILGPLLSFQPFMKFSRIFSADRNDYPRISPRTSFNARQNKDRRSVAGTIKEKIIREDFLINSRIRRKNLGARIKITSSLATKERIKDRPGIISPGYPSKGMFSVDGPLERTDIVLWPIKNIPFIAWMKTTKEKRYGQVKRNSSVTWPSHLFS